MRKLEIFLGCALALLSGAALPATPDRSTTALELFRECEAASTGALHSKGGDLVSDQVAERAVEKFNLCLDYLGAVHDGVHALQTLHVAQPYVCFPRSVSREDERRAFINWARDHQQDLKQNAAIMVLQAFRHAWPCR